MIEYALIVAGGSGVRMQSSTPKQFMVLAGLPVLMHTINAFYQYNNSLQIIIVLPESQHDKWHSLIKQYHFAIPHIIAAGGNTRFDSVKNGLGKINGEGLVAIHDGVRPLIASEIIRNCFEVAKKTGSAVTAVTAKDSIRELSRNSDNKSVNRENYKLVQTPQTFNLELIKQAYGAAKNNNFTDDASVAENAGHQITLVEGDYRNIKITTPEDIKIAQALLNDLSK